jgi:hypothetical protein
MCDNGPFIPILAAHAAIAAIGGILALFYSPRLKGILTRA